VSGRNECAQRAAAKLLARESGHDWRVHHAALRASHPPDTPLRLLGTTPQQLARMLTDSGRPSRALRDAPETALAPGAIACVDLRPLRGGLPRLHWDIVEGVDEAGVRLGERLHAWGAFRRAWACRASPFPMHRRALVVPDV
jgi:hypothetical protein